MSTKLVLPDFPFEIEKFSPEENQEVFKHLSKNFQKYFIRIGPSRYCFNDRFLDLAAKLYNFELRPDDVFVVTFPKAGTTWTQELVWMVANNCDYKTALTVPLVERFPFLEQSMFADNDRARELINEACGNDDKARQIAEELKVPGTAIAAEMPSPRFLKTHAPLSLLPPDILDKTKVVYVARDARDIAVSYYHHQLIMPIYGYVGDFKSFWELYKKGMVDWAPYFEHLKEAWALKDHPNMLFLFYEELSKDLPGIIRRVAKFLDKPVTEEQEAGLCEHLSFENFKKNNAVNYDVFKQIGIILKNKNFIRKGKTGDWRSHFDEEMAKDAEQWIADNLRGTDIKFPQ